MKKYTISNIKVLTNPPKQHVVSLMHNKTFDCVFSNRLVEWEAKQLVHLLELVHNNKNGQGRHKNNI